MIDPITAATKPVSDLTVLLLKPLIEKLQKGASDVYGDAYHRIFNSYRKYLADASERYSYFTSIVFKNEQKKLDDYYLPLTLLKHPLNEETTITSFPRELFSTVKKILIVDSAGMGKTTLLRYLFLRCENEVAGIPIYIELRKLTKERSIMTFIHEQLADLSHFDETKKLDLVYNLLKSGKFVLFLDGYDEIPEDQRYAVTEAIQDFIQKASSNTYLMTSREEIGLTAFPQFQRFKIRPLEKEEAYSLLRKYGDHSYAETLIDKLEQPENVAIHEFLTNPLLASLLYKSFEFKQVIPLRRHIFYRQVFEALYETHDLTKEGGYQRDKKSGMDIDKFDQILRSLGILTYKKEKIEFEKGELLTFIDNAKKLSSDNDATPSSILHDLTHAVPLMIEDGNYIRWTHKSIQEYFAAQYICRNTRGKQEKILSDYFHSKDFTKHLNLVILCADIDRTAFKHSIVKELAQELLAKYDSAYSGRFPGISENDIKRRKRLVVGRSLFLTQIAFPSDLITSPPHIAMYFDSNLFFDPIRAGMNKYAPTLGLDLRYGVRFTQTDVGIGEILNKMSSGVESLHGTELPFIEQVSSFSLSKDPEGCLDRIREAISKPPSVQPINDEPADSLNQEAIFDDISTFLEMYAGWQFNAEKARELLEEIENETKAQEDLMDTLDF